MSEIKTKLSSKRKERAVEPELSNDETKLKVYSGNNEAESEAYSGGKGKRRAVKPKSSEQDAESDTNSLKISQVRETALEKKVKSEQKKR